MKLKCALYLRVFPMLLAAAGISSAATIINSTLEGCVQCAGLSAGLAPGQTVTFTGFTTVQLHLAAGTYTVTDADLTGADSAWTSSLGWNPWYWAFGAANVGSSSTGTTGTVLLEDYIGTAAQVLKPFASQTAAGVATGLQIYDGNNPLSATTLASFSDTFTLGTQSYVDFYVLDQLVSDNGGGIALNVTQVDHAPEPASFLLVVTALAAGGLRLRRRAR
jgi:hypothetical protein